MIEDIKEVHNKISEFLNEEEKNDFKEKNIWKMN